MEFGARKVLVIGIGESGAAASLLLKQLGARVFATDSGSSEAVQKSAQALRSSGINVETGKHTEDFIKDAEIAVVSPGVLEGSEVMLLVKRLSIPVISEIELASLFCKAPAIAITGTNGKSTTVTLTGSMLNAGGKKAIVCGNIGRAFCGQLSDIEKADYVVLEASSFQLKGIRHFRPRIAAIININQNHFDWHPDFKDYFFAKKNIFRNQTKDDFLVLNYDDANLKDLAKEAASNTYYFSIREKVKGAYLRGESLVIDTNGCAEPLCSISDLYIKGSHNVSNVLCAALTAHLAGADKKGMLHAIRNFQGLDHRFQQVCDIRGISFVDDSKATTVDACNCALASCKGNVILIAGGRDKGSDFSVIKNTIKQKVKALILIGEAKDKIRKDLSGATDIRDASSMDEAVSMSLSLAEKNDTVLLSPMCASFDMFKDYKDRGESFCRAVRLLSGKTRADTS